ncbi:MAG: gamma-glutamyltransferase, partial [Planctomycetota bacterium]
MPVFAENVVATSQPLAAQAGLRMLLQGGNAVDAALAAAVALAVVEPTSNGIGSDAFALVWDGRALHGLNGSGPAPMAWTPERFAGRKEMPKFGWDSVTVPGAVDAWRALSRRFGRLPFADLFGPAVEYAQGGFLVSPRTARLWADYAREYEGLPERLPDFAAAFLPGGRPPMPGERFQCPGQADTLRSIAETHGESFYRGRLAERIVAHAAAQGGALALKDLSEHASEWVDPIAMDYRGVSLHEIPPNGQGIAALMALGILRHRNLGELPVDSADSVHLQAEAMKIAFA